MPWYICSKLIVFAISACAIGRICKSLYEIFALAFVIKFVWNVKYASAFAIRNAVQYCWLSVREREMWLVSICVEIAINLVVSMETKPISESWKRGSEQTLFSHFIFGKIYDKSHVFEFSTHFKSYFGKIHIECRVYTHTQSTAHIDFHWQLLIIRMFVCRFFFYLFIVSERVDVPF